MIDLAVVPQWCFSVQIPSQHVAPRALGGSSSVPPSSPFRRVLRRARPAFMPAAGQMWGLGGQERCVQAGKG